VSGVAAAPLEARHDFHPEYSERVAGAPAILFVFHERIGVGHDCGMPSSLSGIFAP
jgi:hypothetical protein